MAAADRRARAVERGVIDLVEAVLLAGREGEVFDGVVIDDGSCSSPTRRCARRSPARRRRAAASACGSSARIPQPARSRSRSPSIRRVPLPPGPRLPPPLQLVGFFSRPTAFMERCHERYGDVFTLRLPGSEPMVFLADPGLVKAVWSRDKVNGLPAGRRITLQPVLGPRSVLLQEGAEHLRRRRLMLPPFHGERMRRYGELMDEITLRDIERWPVGEPFALSRGCSRSRAT